MGWCLFACPPAPPHPVRFRSHSRGFPGEDQCSEKDGVNRTWTRLEEPHTSLLLEALLRLTCWKSYSLTRKHAGCSQGTSAQLQFLRLTGKKKDKTSPFIFLDC